MDQDRRSGRVVIEGVCHGPTTHDAVGELPTRNHFTRVHGDCIALMLPIHDTSALLVISGWDCKVSWLAFIGGKDANRNKATCDGTLSNREKHTLLVKVLLLDNVQTRITVALYQKAYLDWEGLRSILTGVSEACRIFRDRCL